MAKTTPALLFPIGHYLGPMFRGDSSEPEYFRLRVGRQVTKLLGADEVAVWALAHGIPAVLQTEAWTRQALQRHAVQSGHDEVVEVIDALLDAGILIEVGWDIDDLLDFSAQFRLRSLLTGLGPDARLPHAYLLGIHGVPPVLVDPLVYEVWQWAPQSLSLWRACEVYATVQRDGTPPSESETAAELTPFLRRIQVLLSHGAAYLDLAAP